MSRAGGLQIQFVDSMRPCPLCGGPVEDREMSVPAQGATAPVRWVLAGRRCLAGCSLVGEEAAFRGPAR